MYKRDILLISQNIKIVPKNSYKERDTIIGTDCVNEFIRYKYAHTHTHTYIHICTQSSWSDPFTKSVFK